MTVTDFGSGRHDETYSARRREYHYDHRASHQSDLDDRYPFEDEGDFLVAGDSLTARVSRLTHYIAALISVALMVGLMVWGYRLVVRDVSGVPIIRAIEGQARITPDDPGGRLADHGGLSVNGVAAGQAPGAVEQVAIAPDATGLEDGDLPMGQLDAVSPEPVQQAALPSETNASPDAPVLPEGFAIADPAAVELALQEAGAVLDQSLLTEGLDETGIAPIVGGVIASSNRPAPRPQRVAAVTAPTPVTDTPVITEAVTEASAPEPAPEPAPVAVSLASGSPVVQIGAFDSNALAESEWGRVTNRFNALFAGKSQVIQTTKRNGRTFYRLRVAGFESRDDARRFCAALIAEGADCYPTAAQ